MVDMFIDIVNSTFHGLKTLTSNNGTKFVGHEEIAEIIEADFYFAKPYSSSDQGLNEYTNGLIRRFLFKETDFNELSKEASVNIKYILQYM
ncbi:hypothetical protein [Candidatus Enterovibrio escicola]|uniref:hypothetical protein n=2 Tax=Candidatus Enterovibrio escicola TaxID=1927127 RepID=UPI001CC2FCED|nr:hypothetical protein [Candidatus Enterovibrio escacola]